MEGSVGVRLFGSGLCLLAAKDYKTMHTMILWVFC